MNKLLGKKKAAPEPLNQDAFNALTASPQTSPGLRKTSGSRWKKSKKPADPKPSFDLQLNNALPSTDDFRTSLLMPNLSARFSMLREQDDPSSKLGKASDDSVLQPSRRSRKLDFGYGISALNDIAEVQSINGSIRPPFAYGHGATDDGYGSEPETNSNSADSSIMSRARPGEGNTMFGGRQKVYKIAGSSKVGMGKAVYEDDISLSTFQRWRQQNRELHGQRGSEEASLDLRRSGEESQLHPYADPRGDLVQSPSWASARNRSTTSSVARSDTRSSTAATSVISQPASSSPMIHPAQLPPTPTTLPPLKRSDTKTKRLYETGLDQHIQDQQTSAMNKLNSFQKNRPFHLPQLQTAKSTGNLHERANQTIYSSSNNTSMSSHPQNPSLKSPSTAASPTYDSRSHSPTSPDQLASFGADERLALALEPGDRGKATAMGAFNKPAHQFDEQQYLERQHQLQQTQSRSVVSRDSGASSAVQRIGRPESNRTRSNSNLSMRSRSRSDSAPRPSQDSGKPYGSQSQPTTRAAGQFDKSSLPDPHRTFFGNISPSDSEEDEDENVVGSHSAFNYRGWQPNSLPSVSEHPALRQISRSSLDEEAEDHEKGAFTNQKPPRMFTDFKPYADNQGVDSPTLGPMTSRPLNGVMQHLRQRSNQSSIYPNDDDENFANDDACDSHDATRSFDLVQRRLHGNLNTDSGIGSSITHSNPWDLDEFDMLGENESSATRPSEPALHEQAPRPQDPSHLAQQTVRTHDQSEDSLASSMPWQTEFRKQHHLRDASSATQQERDAFANELAARRNAIQESMRSMVAENQSNRTASPARTPSSAALKALGKIRSKPSRETVSDAKMTRDRSVSSKARHVITGAANNSTTNFQIALEKAKQNAEAAAARDRSVPRPDIQTTGLQRPLQPSDWVDPDSGMVVDRSAIALAQPTSRPAGSRSRSNSAKSGLRGRPSVRHDEGAHMDVPVSQFRQELTPRPSPEPSQQFFEARDRKNSNGRQGPNGFSDNLNPQSRAPPPANISSPPSTLSRASPSNSGFSHNVTPPLSGANTPQSQAFASPPLVPQAQSTHQGPPQRSMGNSLRKKTISKSDISEPTLISSTSNVDTVELPPGASLKNGMNDPPPVPPINPKRRVARKLLGIVRNESGEEGQIPTLASMHHDPYARRSNSSNEERSARPSTSTPNLAYNQNGSARSQHPASPTRMHDGAMF